MSKRIPKDLASAIEKCWPGGEVDQFDDEESYFHEISASLERDLRTIRGTSLQWQTSEDYAAVRRDDWDDDWEHEPPLERDWQSYRVFFLAPDGAEFHYENEPGDSAELGDFDVDEDVDLGEDEDDEEEAGYEPFCPVEGWIGCSVAISLAAPFALIGFDELARDQDGNSIEPDVDSCAYAVKAGKWGGDGEHGGTILDEKSIRKMEKLRAKIADIVAKHGIQVLDPSTLDQPVPGLAPGEVVFLEKLVRVRDAFFFRGP
ncbi:MAG: hypothetical protein LAQ69_47250 [Acidobacteriia bacterium]|nr:hypothetical protein [Terriglobia bacterium]